MSAAERSLPAVDYVAAFLRDAARQDASVWTVVNVIKQFLDDGLPKRDAVRAAKRAEDRALPAEADLIRLYRDGIQKLLAEPVAGSGRGRIRAATERPRDGTK